MPYRRQGQPERLSTTVKDIGGNLADPGDISLILRDPLRVKTTIDYNPGPIVRDGLGLFHYDLAGLTLLGGYAYVWKTTGANAGTTSRRDFTLVDDFTPLLLTFDEAKSQINVTGVPDADLERFVDSACTEVENGVGQPVVPQVVTRLASVLPDGRLLLPHHYIVPGSITAATQNGVAISTASWELSDTMVGSGTGGVITGAVAPWGTIKVTYTPGFDPMEEPLREAAGLYVQAAMETQRGPASVPLAEDIPGSAASYTLILRARDKVAPYRVQGVA